MPANSIYTPTGRENAAASLTAIGSMWKGHQTLSWSTGRNRGLMWWRKPTSPTVLPWTKSWARGWANLLTKKKQRMLNIFDGWQMTGTITVLSVHQLPVILALSCAFCVDSGKWWPGKSRQNTMKRPKEKEPSTLSCIQTGLPKTITYVHKWHLCSSARVAWTKSSKKCPVSVDNFQIFVIVVGKYAKKSSEEDFKRWVSFCWFYCKPYLITG